MPDGTGCKITDEAPGAADSDAAKGARTPKCDVVLGALLDAGMTFWRDADGEPHASVPTRAGAIARYRVRSRAFASVVRGIFGRANGRTMNGATVPGSVSDQVWKDVRSTLESMAAAGPKRHADVRLVRADGAVWLDLGGDAWRTVRIDADGWRTVEAADVPLVRPDALRELPEPVADADALANLRRLLNVGSDRDFRLMVAWLVAALHPSGPYPILALDGEQGSAKSTTCEMLRRLIDPNKCNLRAPPRNEADLIVAAGASRIVALDNVSFIDSGMADALCRVATGAGIGKRTLYTDGDEYIVSVSRPILLNGIPSLLGRGDLADRALAVTLPTIPDDKRRTAAAVWADFDAAAPGILALLLNGLATALRNLPTLADMPLTRMADFCNVARACAPAFGWTEAEMLDAINRNRADAVEAVIEADAVADALRDFAATSGRWAGTATELLAVLNERAPLALQREQGWPKDGTRLSSRLRRINPALRRFGIEVTVPEKGGRGGRIIRITPATAEAERCDARNAGNAVPSYVRGGDAEEEL